MHKLSGWWMWLCLAGLPLATCAQADFWVTTEIGTGTAGSDGDGGPARQAQVNNPFGVVRGPDGAIWFCEYDGHTVRRVTADGSVQTRVGTGQAGYGGDGGPAARASLNKPHEIRFDRDGNLFIADTFNHVIRRVDRESGVISTYAGTGQEGYSGDDGPATGAQFKQPHSIQFGPDGHLYVCDTGNHVLRRIDTERGMISTIGGTGKPGPTPDGSLITETPLHGPRSLDFDRDGRLWLATREGNQVFRIRLDTGRVEHMAGTGARGFSGNGGPAREATLSGPKGIAVSAEGLVYLVDTESHSIRVVDPRTGQLDVWVGTGQRGDGPDGPALECRLARPHGIWLDADGSAWIGDSENHRVRKVTRRY